MLLSPCQGEVTCRQGGFFSTKARPPGVLLVSTAATTLYVYGVLVTHKLFNAAFGSILPPPTLQQRPARCLRAYILLSVRVYRQSEGLTANVDGVVSHWRECRNL